MDADDIHLLEEVVGAPPGPAFAEEKAAGVAPYGGPLTKDEWQQTGQFLVRTGTIEQAQQLKELSLVCG